MNLFLWMFAGSVLGWVALSFLDLNAARGMWVSVIIGAIGGVLGGKLIAPVFVSASVVPGETIHKRWGV